MENIQNDFKISCDFTFKGDQQQAVDKLSSGVLNGMKEQTLLGVTGSGKTFTMAGIIERLNKPTLVLAHNKILAAQLCAEFKMFFPNNAVEYFVSYYNYYRPESYIAATDTYIEKNSAIDDEIDKLRHSATSAIAERNDVIIISSVSCIYNLGDPYDYKSMVISLRPGMAKNIQDLIEKLKSIQYKFSEKNFERGNFCVRDNIVDIFPVETSVRAIRIEFINNKIESISQINPITGQVSVYLKHVAVYPASHYIVPKDKLISAIDMIEAEMVQRVEYFKNIGKSIEAQRIQERTKYDIEMLTEIGFCKGIENYSGILAGRVPGTPPFTLFDFFPKDFLMFIDESHVTLPQVHAMHAGDRVRKQNLVNYGFRLPSAADNRPLTYEEFYDKINKIIFVSATPGDFELSQSAQVVEQIIRPTGIVDPKITLMPIDKVSQIPKNGIVFEDINTDKSVQEIIELAQKNMQEDTESTPGQMADLIERINKTILRYKRVLITTLTKKMAEDLTSYLSNKQIKVKYMHSDIETIERMQIIKELRLGIIDVLVGINLLREGLDIPEASLVVILDADKEGFLRTHRSLIQNIGRAARNSEGEVVMYCDNATKSMILAITETMRRRKLQIEYNTLHNIIPKTIVKPISEILEISIKNKKSTGKKMSKKEKTNMIKYLESQMLKASERLDYETASVFRDELDMLKKEKP
ncbi:MAG: excinuclease ABC subunit UvrB [Candidatus Improbicoccus devescovinae]|nr:MAG: excinuclease ABC subunit UvrB [Candidatus Improbicoccus devescovinae]